jgi:hypothetical protein
MTERFLGFVLICLAGLIWWWLQGDLRRGRTWMGSLWTVRREAFPPLFWLAVISHAVLALTLFVVGLLALLDRLPPIG